MEIRPLRAKLFHADLRLDRRTDMTGVFAVFLKVRKMMYSNKY